MSNNCFVCGKENEEGMQLTFKSDKNNTYSYYKFPEKFQGWDNVIHGGILSTLLDEVMAKSCINEGFEAVTRKINIEYLKPVKVGQKLKIVGKIKNIRKKLIEAEAEIIDENNGTIYATGKSLFWIIKEI